MIFLDFEQPIAELEAKIDEMKQLAESNKVDLSVAIASVEQQLLELKKDTYQNLTRWQRVQLSRHPERPYALDYIENMCEEFIELHGDRGVADDKAMIGGFGRIGEQSIMFIGQQKGRNTKQRQYRNFGMPNPEGYRKALRLMKLADKFKRPIVTLIDTPGAFPGIEAEERGQGEAIARNLKEMFNIKVPIISIIIGEGASGGALGIAIGDKVLMLEYTWYSVISPEALSLTANDMLKNKLIDGIVEEPLGGAHTNPQKMYATLKKVILDNIKKLEKIEVEKRLEQRIEKFCKMGAFNEK